MICQEWFKNTSSSALLLNELDKRGLPNSAKRVFRECRFVKPLYFTDGILFNEPQLIAANRDWSERYFILGRFRDYTTFLIDCKTGRLGQGEARIDFGEDYNFQNIADFPIFLDRELLAKFGTCSQLPEDVFDVSISATLKRLDVPDDDSALDTRPFQQWLRERHIPEAVWPFFSALRYSCEVPAGGGVLFQPDVMMKVNDSWQGLLEQGFLVIGSRPVDAEMIVIDFRCSSFNVGLMALEEAFDFVYERHFMTVSPSFERYLHDSNFLENLPFDFYDARDFKTDLNWF